MCLLKILKLMVANMSNPQERTAKIPLSASGTDFDAHIDRRGTGSVKWDKVAEGVLPMSIADLDFYTPPPIVAAVRKRLEHEAFGYTFGDGGAFDAIVAWFSRTYGVTIEKSWLTLLPGIVPALAVLSDAADGSVLTNTPNYSNLLRAPSRAGKELISTPLKNEDERYSIDFSALESAAAQDAGLFYLCNPHNPVGKVYTRGELEELSEFTHKKGLLTVSDEIHCELVYDAPHIPFLTTKYGLENSITLMAPGKTCNIPGIPFAFAIVPNPEILARVKKIGYGFGGTGVLGNAAGRAAYAECDGWKRDLVAYLRGNRDYLSQELARRFPKARFPHTSGTYLQWIDFRAYIPEKPHEWLLKNAKLAINGGEHFGGDGYVRLNFGCPRSTLTDALDRIERAFAEHQRC
jgi:cystathionine beta-lyase